MENNNTQTYEVKDVLGFVVNGLGNIVLPVSILGALNPEQIMAIKQLVINPIAVAKANLVECIKAIDREEAQNKDRQRAQEGQKEAPAAEGEQEPGMEPIRLSERREEAAEDGRGADAE